MYGLNDKNKNGEGCFFFWILQQDLRNSISEISRKDISDLDLTLQDVVDLRRSAHRRHRVREELLGSHQNVWLGQQ